MLLIKIPMGEAKRRKQLDSHYGSTPSLTSQSQKQKHVDLIVDSLTNKFEHVIKEISAAEFIIETYDKYKQKVSIWLNQKLEPYCPSDRILIASSIMTVYAEIAIKHQTSPLLIKFFFDVLQPFLSVETSQRLENIVKKIEAEFAHV